MEDQRRRDARTSGQPQAGVDVYGTDRIEQRFTGVQCKGKDRDFGRAVTEAELRAEVAKARTFQPPLDVFVLATTAPNDHAIQHVAREITADHAKIGLFEVRVTGWTTFRNYITDYQEVLLKYYHDLAPVDLLGQIAGTAEQQARGFAQTEKMLRTAMRMIADGRDNPDSSDQLAMKVTEISRLIGDGSPRAAIRALERVQAEEGEAASPLGKYRILASLGNAHYVLGEEDRAVALFYEAFEANPEFANAQATKAMALIIEGRRAEAEPIAAAAYFADRSSPRNASIWIDSLSPTTPVDEIKAALSSDILDTVDIQLHLAVHSHENGDEAGHRAHAEAALALASDDWRAMSAVAGALLQPLSTMDGLGITHDLPDAYREDTERAVGLMQRAWGKLAERDSSFQGRHVAANLISLLGLFGRDAEAELVLDQALATNANYAPLAIFDARRLSANGKWNAAANVLDAIPRDELTFDGLLLRTQAAFQLNDPAGAVAWAAELRPVASSQPNVPERASLVEAMQIRAAILNGADRDESIAAALATEPKSIVLRSVLFDDLKDDDPLREQLVGEIKSLARGDISLRERVHAAETLYVSGHYSMAADLYAPLHGTADSYALRRRLQALHLADRRAEARRLFETLAPELRSSDGYVSLGVAIYERAGLLKPALKLVERSLEHHDVLRNRMIWIQLLIRLRRPDQMRKWLTEVSEDIEGAPIDLVGLAQLIDRYVGDDPKALILGYRALRTGYGKPQIHLAYSLGLIIGGHVNSEAMEAPPTVEPGIGVVMVNSATGEELHRLIETGPNPVVERDEISPEDAFAQRLLGLRVGDDIEFVKLGLGPQTYRVVEIQSRFLFAFRRTMREFPTLFPDNPAFGSFTIDDSKGDDRFEEMFAVVRSRAEQGRQLESTYRDNIIPIGMFARFSGASVFDVWESFAQNSELGLKVALGIDSEFQAGRTAASRGVLVVEPLSIYAWARIGLAPLVRKLSQRLAVVQSTIDALRQLAEERESQHDRKMGTLGYDGNKYILVEMTEEDVTRQVADAKAALDLAEALPLVPAETDAALPNNVADLLRDLHPAYHDTLIAALQPHHALVTDDLGYRVVAQEAGAQVTWTQAFAQQAHRTLQLSHPEYRQVVAALQDANYRFVQFSAVDVLGELQDSGWKVSDRLRHYARELTSDKLDEQSTAVVLAEFLLQGRQQAQNVRDLILFPSLVVSEGLTFDRKDHVREVFKLTRRMAQILEQRAINRLTLPRKLLGTTSLIPVHKLIEDSVEMAKHDVSRLWSELREAGFNPDR